MYYFYYLGEDRWKWRCIRRDASRSYCVSRYWNIPIIAGCPWTWQKCKPDNKSRIPIYLIFFKMLPLQFYYKNIRLSEAVIVQGWNTFDCWLLIKVHALVKLLKGYRSLLCFSRFFSHFSGMNFFSRFWSSLWLSYGVWVIIFLNKN